ncbi:MAG: hypothetical protein JKY67_11290 [Pseudomonadales bacterium]|nr:hypothetical protein [Pseudomonadales bacterium]
MILSYKEKLARVRRLKVYVAIKEKSLTGEKIRQYLNSGADRDYFTEDIFVYDEVNATLEFPKKVRDLFDFPGLKL